MQEKSIAFFIFVPFEIDFYPSLSLVRHLRFRLTREQRFDELFAVEDLQVLHFFA